MRHFTVFGSICAVVIGITLGILGVLDLVQVIRFVMGAAIVPTGIFAIYQFVLLTQACFPPPDRRRIQPYKEER